MPSADFPGAFCGLYLTPWARGGCTVVTELPSVAGALLQPVAAHGIRMPPYALTRRQILIFILSPENGVYYAPGSQRFMKIKTANTCDRFIKLSYLEQRV